MTIETLKKANDLVDKLEVCKKNLSKIEYTQNESVVIRRSYLSFNGVEGSVMIPESLFRLIGKLIKAEYIQEVKKLQKKLDEL